MHSVSDGNQAYHSDRMRPRFLKLRRHSTSQQRKSGGDLEYEILAGLDPFISPESNQSSIEVNHSNSKITGHMSNNSDSSVFLNSMSNFSSQMCNNLNFRNSAEVGVSAESLLGTKHTKGDTKRPFIFGNDSVKNMTSESFNVITPSSIKLEQPVVDTVNHGARGGDHLKQIPGHPGFVFGACNGGTHGSSGLCRNNRVKKNRSKSSIRGSQKTGRAIIPDFRNHEEANYLHFTAQKDLKINPNSKRNECRSEVKDNIGEENNHNVHSFHSTMNNCDSCGSHNNLNGMTDNIYKISKEMIKLNVSGFQNKESAYFCGNSAFQVQNGVSSPRFPESCLDFSKDERCSLGDNHYPEDGNSYERRNILEKPHQDKEEPIYEFCKNKQHSLDLKNIKSGNLTPRNPSVFVFHATNDIDKCRILPNPSLSNDGLSINSCMFEESYFRSFVCSGTSKPSFQFRKACANMRSKSVNHRKSKKELRKHRKEFQSCGSDFVWQESGSRMNKSMATQYGCFSPMDFSPYQENPPPEQHSGESGEPSNSGNSKEGCNFDEAEGVNKKTGIGFRFSSEREESNHGDKFLSSLNPVNAPSENFKFTSSSSRRHGSVGRRYLHRMRHEPHGDKYKRANATFSSVYSSGQPSPAPSISQFAEPKCLNKNKDREDKSKSADESVEDPHPFSTVFEKTCQKWRLSGNQAYKEARFLKAEGYYTNGVNSVPLDERKGHCAGALVLCYSNRAAAKISLGKIREALEDCLVAIALDPSFNKAHIRAANCYLLLGEAMEASQHYNKCIESGKVVCLDRRTVLEAYDGVKNAEKVDKYTKQCFKLLEIRTPDDAVGILEEIDDVLSISPHSETLIEFKAGALYILQKYEEAIHLCKETKYVAEKNFPCSRNSWRFHLESIALFHLGKLDAALELLDNHKHATSFFKNCWKSQLDLTQFAGVVGNLLRHKNAGNKSFRSGEYAQAVEHYTAALSENIDSRPFVAVCFCNRAAAYEALGEITNAIADCSISIALDQTYRKAISRRATLYEMIGEYNQAEGDLTKLVDVLEKQHCGRFSDNEAELGMARARLSVIADKAKKGLPMNFHLILGIKESDSGAEVRKAYRKAALRHHPDKILTKSGNREDGQAWKNILNEIHKDADLLFKIVGEAYSVLSALHKRVKDEGDERKAKNATAQWEHSTNGENYSRKGSHAPHFRRCPENQKWNWKKT